MRYDQAAISMAAISSLTPTAACSLSDSELVRDDDPVLREFDPNSAAPPVQ
jgi:hypothetical protein